MAALQKVVSFICVAAALHNKDSTQAFPGADIRSCYSRKHRHAGIINGSVLGITIYAFNFIFFVKQNHI